MITLLLGMVSNKMSHFSIVILTIFWLKGFLIMKQKFNVYNFLYLIDLISLKRSKTTDFY